MNKGFVLIMGLLLMGCIYAGPFVTNIRQDKSGTLMMEKCIVEHNILGTVATKNCTTVPV